jgi:DinB family protein
VPPPDSTTLLARLERMPGELRAAAARLGERHALDAPPGGGFSLVEQAWHLADLEREGFGARITRLLEEEAPFLPDFDGARIARERDYRSRPLDAGLQAFAAARAANLARLRSVPEAAWHRTGTQEGVGPVTLADLPRLMLEHDDSHRKELAALLQ